MSMTDKEVLSNLCYYDTRNPDNILEDLEEAEILRLKSKKCFCDNCFKGRHQLAVELIEARGTPAPSPINKHVGNQCPRCCNAILEDDFSGHAVCPNEDDDEGLPCGFTTVGLDDEDNEVAPPPSHTKKESLGICNVEGCKRESRIRGRCIVHYQGPE